MARFANVTCSQCGRSFGPGDAGFSTCSEHHAAAATDLLAALQGLDDAYCRAGDGLTRAERNEDRQRLMAARAAIAKATGGAQ